MGDRLRRLAVPGVDRQQGAFYAVDVTASEALDVTAILARPILAEAERIDEPVGYVTIVPR